MMIAVQNAQYRCHFDGLRCNHMAAIRYDNSVPAATSRKPVRRMPRRQSEDVFAKASGTLNDAQKQAVDTIEGPVMVVAGPGTGKTQVLALRVANILMRTQAKPHNILCLTFSKSGATAMRERLRSIIGADAYGVTIETIHGFCNDVIVRHPAVFEDWSALHQITDVERYRLLNKIIDQFLPQLELVNQKFPYGRTGDILGRISQLKKEGVTDATTLRRIADQFEKQQSEKSKTGTKVHERNLLQARKFRELVELFLRYQEQLRETRRYDYDDMILKVIGALRREDWLLASYQERYQYLLVDEFQDTNGAQYQLLDVLTQDPTDQAPNFFVVGDDDQAIYRFQGANLQNILSFHKRFPKAPVIALTVSYRCSQTILTAAENLIEQNEERLVGHIAGLDKHLKSATDPAGIPPKLLRSVSDMSEPWLIADLIEERLKAGIQPESIAVIVQTNAELVPLYDVLRARGIAVQLSGKLDLLGHPLVGQVVAILRAIHHPQESAALASALACSCFGCHPTDLAQIFRARREQSVSVYDILLNLDSLEVAFRNRDALVHARDVLLDLHQKAPHRTIIETLEHVYQESGLLIVYQRGEMDIVDFAAAQEFFDRVRQRAAEEKRYGFESFLDDLEYYGNNEYREVRLTYDLPHLTRTGVQMMTAHKSKGLEFDTVIMANFREGHWDKRRNPPSVAMPEDLLFGWRAEAKDFEKSQDERRVAYVAMTRAKRELLFICPRELTTGDATKSVSPSAFFAEAGHLPEEDCEIRDPKAMSTLLQKPVRDFDTEFEAYLRKRLEIFSLSATALNRFLKDPEEFLQIDLLERPQAKESFFAYGNAIHHALAKWALQVKAGKPLTTQQLLNAFKHHLETKEILTTAERSRLEHLGEHVLNRYAKDRLNSPYPVIDKVEFSLTARLGDIPLKGKLDRIELDGPNSAVATVIDFKTGKPQSEKAIRDGDYFRQLVFYSLLMEQGQPLLRPRAYVLDFVGERADHPVFRSFAITEAEKASLRALVEAVWQKILALDFSPL